MCIRDSLHGAHRALALGGRHLALGGRRWRDEHHAGGRDRCLLYTSDAADERSSVDLGGRRIIKKKNSVSTSGGRLSHRVHDGSASTTTQRRA